MPAFLSVYPYDIESPIENPSICLQKYLFHIVLILTNKQPITWFPSTIQTL